MTSDGFHEGDRLLDQLLGFRTRSSLESTAFALGPLSFPFGPTISGGVRGVLSVTEETLGSEAAHPPSKIRHRNPRNARRVCRISASFINMVPPTSFPIPYLLRKGSQSVTVVFVPE